MFHFKPKYLLLTILIFIIEILIALFVNDKIIRPFIGDLLVVVLIYCFLRAFWNTSPKTVAISTLLFSFSVEIAQYFNIVELMGLQNNRFAVVLIGNVFSWLDLIAYSVGVFISYKMDVKDGLHPSL